jgi:hypothetical protein
MADAYIILNLYRASLQLIHNQLTEIIRSIKIFS